MSQRDLITVSLEPVVKPEEGSKSDGELLAYINRISDEVTRSRPLITRKAAERVRQCAYTANDEALGHLMANYPDSGFRRAFTRHNKLVSPAGGSAGLVPNIPGVDTEPLRYKEGDPDEVVDALAQRARKVHDKIVRREREARMEQPVKLQLSDFFFDADVMQKYSLTPIYSQLVKRTACYDPHGAVNLLRTKMAKDGHNVIIRVGEFTQGVKFKMLRICEATRGLKACPKIFGAEYIDNMIAVRHEGDAVTPAWTIMVPSHRGHLVPHVYALCLHNGVADTLAVWQCDFMDLGIICQFDDPLYDGMGTFVQHAGVHEELDCDIPSVGIVGTGVTQGVVPVVRRGKSVGSAVRVGEDTVVLPWHVFSLSETEERYDDCVDAEVGLGVRIGGEVYPVTMEREIGTDMWAARHEVVRGAGEPWRFSRARIGDYARLVYAGDGGASFVSDVVRISRVEGKCVVTERPVQAREGLSGAALVSVTSGALVGLYRGATVDACVFSAVDTMDVAPTRFRPIQDEVNYGARMEAASDGTCDSELLYADLCDRGYRSELVAIAGAMEAVVDGGGRTMGTSLHYGSEVLTTVDPTVWDISLADTAVSKPASRGGLAVFSLPAARAGGYTVRGPQLKEQVVVIAKDGSDVVFSSVLHVVSVSPDGTVVTVSGVPSYRDVEFLGGVVVSLTDVSVVGMYSHSLGGGSGAVGQCVSIVGADGRSGAPSKWAEMCERVDSVCGTLSVAWPDNTCSVVAGGHGPGRSLLSSLGRSAVRTAVMAHYRRGGDDATASVAATLVTNSAWVSQASDATSMADLLSGGGDGLLAGSKAENFFILCGAIESHEVGGSLTRVLLDTGWFTALINHVAGVTRSKRPVSVALDVNRRSASLTRTADYSPVDAKGFYSD